MLNSKYGLPAVLALLLLACGGGGGGGAGGGAAPVSSSAGSSAAASSVASSVASSAASSSISYTISLDFERVPSGSLNPFVVRATVLANGAPKTGIAGSLAITLGRGTRGAVTEASAGVYQFTVTPTQTGEHAVTVAYGGASLARTPLVLAYVDGDWDQPMAVPGLVNTAGYEDGTNVTPDGEYLFVQYAPVYFTGFTLFDTARASGGCGGHRLLPTRCTHPWLDNVMGPVAAPERPGFFSGRFSGSSFLHNSLSWGVGPDQTPNWAVSTMLYGFKRQADGSYAQPFWLSFDDAGDALMGAYGISVHPNGDGTATVFFAFDDPSDPDMVDFDGDGSVVAQSLTDIFTQQITLGSNTSFGKFVASGTPGTHPVRSTPFPAQLVNFGKVGIEGIAGTQGNPHAYYSGGALRSIWTDDERDSGGDRGDIAANVLTSGSLASGTWAKVVLPPVVNVPLPSDERQPFFTGSGLYFTRNTDTVLPEIFYAPYSGTQSTTDLQDASKWTTPKKILGVAAADAIGKLSAIGEPAIATIAGKEHLYFVYAVIRGYDVVSGLPDIDMQIGLVRRK